MPNTGDPTLFVTPGPEEGPEIASGRRKHLKRKAVTGEDKDDTSNPDVTSDRIETNEDDDVKIVRDMVTLPRTKLRVLGDQYLEGVKKAYGEVFQRQAEALKERDSTILEERLNGVLRKIELISHSKEIGHIHVKHGAKALESARVRLGHELEKQEKMEKDLPGPAFRKEFKRCFVLKSRYRVESTKRDIAFCNSLLLDLEQRKTKRVVPDGSR